MSDSTDGHERSKTRESRGLDVAVSPERLRLVEAAVATWRSKLLDLSGNNRLIYYRSLKRGTLDLSEAHVPSLGRLLGGNGVRISQLFPMPDPAELIGSDDSDQSTGTLEEAAKLERRHTDSLARAKTLRSTGVANLEERGIRTLSLASHLATWDAGDSTAATPNAPVLLRSLEIRATSSGMKDFTLVAQGEWEVSQTLLLFWAETFGLDLDKHGLNDASLEKVVMSNQDAPDAIVDYVLASAETAGSIPRLTVRGGVLVGNFVYTKLPMVKDLETNIDKLAEHPLIAAIAGDADAAAAVRADNNLSDTAPDFPDTIPPQDEYLVLDADSSQSQVINGAAAGRSMIVEGPPGTGKSQTISNLIAGLTARGNSVLFVAEKRAAIEAVLKRLERPGLVGEEPGPDLATLALDLHSSTIRKKEAALALAGSLNRFAEIARPEVKLDQAYLTKSRARVVDYEHELHVKFEPFGRSSFDINEAILAAGCDLPYVTLDQDTISKYSPEWMADIEDLLERWIRTRRRIDWSSAWVSSTAFAVDDAEIIVETVRQLRSTWLPELDDLLNELPNQIADSLASTSLGGIVDVSNQLDEAAEINEQVEPEFWKLNLEEIAVWYQQRGRFSILSGGFRSARKQLREVTQKKLSDDDQQLFVERAVELRAATGAHIPSTIDDELRSDLGRALRAALDRLGQVSEMLSTDCRSISLAELREQVTDLVATESNAVLVAQLRQHRREICGHGCEALVLSVETGECDEDVAVRSLNLSVLRGIKSTIDLRNPVLNAFDSSSQTGAVAAYSERDRKHVRSGPDRVLRAVAERATSARNAHPAQSAIIEREAKKSRRHRPLRQLHTEAREVLMALRPCWMMSPLMVAQTLPADSLFDYVIFDEASQIRPEEAISAILRGRNIIVAGDRRQLPPSAFFGGAMGAAGDVDDYDEDEVDALTEGYESILDVTSALLPVRMLTWHYRSEDERLIKLSNDHIYGRSLTTFPGAVKDTPISFHKVDHVSVDVTQIRSNPTEVGVVVDLMLRHAMEKPNESLGVIAFGQHHASAIEDELHRRLASTVGEEINHFFDENLHERVFVKNIERVQGDERDVIILTIGYGKDMNGVVPRRFGPVNQQGGERRINVAASRARKRMTVVASITHTDFDPSGMKPGPQLLQALLQFAASGGNDTGAAGTVHPLNAFELAVKYELEQLGLKPISQYGSSGFRIDFALADPTDPNRMVLAVEADGASYHSSPTARDRDRLRQQVLEGRGWQFHRIWSTAFFADPKREARRVEAAFQAALSGEALLVESDLGELKPRLNPQKVGPRKPAFRKGKNIDDYDHRVLVELAKWMTSDGENLMTNEELKDSMRIELGFQRRGSRIEAAFDRALRDIERNSRTDGHS